MYGARQLLWGRIRVLFFQQCDNALSSNSEQPLGGKAGRVRFQRLAMTDQKLLVRVRLHERVKTPIVVDVVDYYCASGRQLDPSTIDFEPHIVFGMRTVMEEEVYLSGF